MVKELVVDTRVRDTLLSEQPHGVGIGLIIGTLTETEEYCLAHLALTLEEVLSDTTDPGNGSGDADAQLRRQTFNKINLATISHHVKQVIRMLPGGLTILGFFVIEPVQTIFTTKYEPMIISLLATLNKSLSRNPHYGADFGKNDEKVVLHYQPATKQYIVRLFDGNTLKKQDMEVVFRKMEWSKLESEYDTFYAMHLAKQDVGIPLRKNMKVLMDTFQEVLHSATYVINGKRPSKSDPYVEQTPRVQDSGVSDTEDDVLGDHSESTGGSGSSSPRHQYSDSGNESESENPQNRPVSPLHILIEKTPGLVRPTEPGQDFVTHLHLVGKIATVAFAPTGSSTFYVVEMVKKDILRSLTARIEMHCESLIEEEQGTEGQEEGTSKVYHEIPRRVFAHLPGSSLLVSDYLFPGEGPTDSLASFQDILTLGLTDEKRIIMSKERAFNLDDLRSKGSLEELLSKVDPINISNNIHRSSAIGFVLVITLMVALAGVLIPMFMRSE